MGNSLETETASEYGSVKEGILSDFDYDRFREAGIPIGSGEVESAHRYISQKRLKIPGATWHPDTPS